MNKKRKVTKRIAAWFIYLAMVLTTINLPAFTTEVKAAESSSIVSGTKMQYISDITPVHIEASDFGSFLINKEDFFNGNFVLLSSNKDRGNLNRYSRGYNYYLLVHTTSDADQAITKIWIKESGDLTSIGDYAVTKAINKADEGNVNSAGKASYIYYTKDKNAGDPIVSVGVWQDYEDYFEYVTNEEPELQEYKNGDFDKQYANYGYTLVGGDHNDLNKDAGGAYVYLYYKCAPYVKAQNTSICIDGKSHNGNVTTLNGASVSFGPSVSTIGKHTQSFTVSKTGLTSISGTTQIEIKEHDFTNQPYLQDKEGKEYQKCKFCGYETEHVGKILPVLFRIINGTAQVYNLNPDADITGDLVIPDTVFFEGKNYTVTEIDSYAFYNNGNFKGDLIIPDSVTTIGRAAFSSCKFTGKLSIGKGVITIGEQAFYDCGFTGNLIIPNSVTTIGNGAFRKGGFTGNLTIPNSVTTISNDAFSDCGFTGDLIIPNSVTTIGRNAFSDCGFNGKLIIPDSVTTIGNGAFLHSGFTGNLIIPNSVTTIGDDAFIASSFTGELIIPDGVTTIGSGAFGKCGFTGDLIIPDSVTTIGGGIVYECNNIDSISIPCSINSGIYFGVSADKVTRRNHVIVDNKCTVCDYEECHITGNHKFSADAEVVKIDGNTHGKKCSNCGEILATGTHIFSKDNCQGVCADCGANNNKHTFDNDDEYQSECIACHHGFFYYTPIEGNVVQPASPKNLKDADGKALTILSNTIVDGKGTIEFNKPLVTIGEAAFIRRNNIKGNLVIPNTVTKIDDYAFKDCEEITGLTIPDSVQIIGKEAFYDCIKLTSLNIPNNVTSIGNEAFYLCKGLSGNVIIPDNVILIGNNIFGGCENITSVSVPCSSSSWLDLGNEVSDKITKRNHDFVASSDDRSQHICLVCSLTKKHSFSAECDATCNDCGYERNDATGTHNFVDGVCSACGASKPSVPEIQDISLQDVIISNPIYSGKAQTPTVTIENGGTTLVKGQDYTVKVDSAVEFSEAGYPIIITGIGDYTGTINNTWFIQKATPSAEEIAKNIPNNLSAVCGSSLLSVSLPSVLQWTDDNTSITGGDLEAGQTITGNAKYTPIDSKNYESVDNVELNIVVTHRLTYQMSDLDHTKHIGHCSECNKDFVQRNHDFSNYQSNKAATCKDNATETGTCICGAEDEREIEGTKLDTHSYVNGVCSVCDKIWEVTENGITYKAITDVKEGKPVGVTVSGNDLGAIAVSVVSANTVDESVSNNSVVIAGELTGNGTNQKFIVTKIEKDAFAGSGMNSLVIPASVTELGENALGNASTVTFEGMNPPAGIEGAIKENAKINIPEGSKDKYQIVFNNIQITINEAHTHKFAEEWSYDKNNHWKASACGHDDTVVKLTHTFGEWITVKDASETEEGSKKRSCACGYEETEPIAKLEVKPSDKPADVKPSEKPSEDVKPSESPKPTGDVTPSAKPSADVKPSEQPKLTKQTITVAKAAKKTVTFKASKLKAKKATIKLGAKAKTKISYKVSKYPKNAKKYISVSSKGVVTMKKGAKKGTYKVTITAKADKKYAKATKVITIKVK